MSIRSRMIFVVISCFAWMIGACGGVSPAEDNPASDSTATLPVLDAVTATAVPSVENPITTAAVTSELTQEQILQIVRSSLAAFPWRLEQSVQVTSSGQTTTSLTEVQSSSRGYNRSDQTLGNETITIESILIDQMLYLKITGSPAETYGLVSGQWAEVPPGSPLSQLADTSAVDPARIAEIFAVDFASIAGESGLDEMRFEAVGSEDVNGVPTTIYEAKGETFTYRWWVGSDGRFYKTSVEKGEATRTIVITYDPSINVQAPMP